MVYLYVYQNKDVFCRGCEYACKAKAIRQLDYPPDDFFPYELHSIAIKDFASMCGVIGIVGKSSQVATSIYDGLLLLQHRGQDAAGIVTGNHEGQIFSRRSLGLVRDVFQQRHMERLKGPMGVGHLRYPTAGLPSVDEAQPFYVNSPFGLSLIHI